MECTSCGYALWNRPEPYCPECGQAFDLRAYRFRPNTVAFLCPHCQHPHGGTGDAWLPATTDQAACLSCGEAMDVISMPVVPTVNPPISGIGSAIPWEADDGRGPFKRWWATFSMAINRPSKLGAALCYPGHVGVAYWFAVAAYSLLPLVALAVVSVLAIVMAFTSSLMSATGEIAAGTVLLLIIPFVMPALWVVLGALPAHVILQAIGPTDAGLGGTVKAYLYGQAPQLIGSPLLACIGVFQLPIFGLWSMFIIVHALVAAHQTTALKATIAVCATPVIVTIGLAVLIVIMI